MVGNCGLRLPLADRSGAGDGYRPGIAGRKRSKGERDTYRPEQGNDYLEYWEAGVRHQIWWKAHEGMKEKWWRLATENRLAGVALWRLGYEEGRVLE